MKGKQIAMTAMLEDVDRYTLAREKAEEEQVLAKLRKEYREVPVRELYMRKLEEGTVLIIRQELYRNNHYTAHFYRTVLGYHRTVSGMEAHLVWEGSEEWPDEPPWQTGIDDRKDKRWKYPNGMEKHWMKAEDSENDRRDHAEECAD